MYVTKIARARYLRLSPQKLRQVADTIRGLKADAALAQLNFLPKRRLAVALAKTLKSAVANAVTGEYGHERLHPENLSVTKVMVDGAPLAKRMEFRAMGRVNRILRRYSHLTVEVGGETSVVQATRRRGGKTEAEVKEVQAVADTGAVSEKSVKPSSKPKKSGSAKVSTKSVGGRATSRKVGVSKKGVGGSKKGS